MSSRPISQAALEALSKLSGEQVVAWLKGRQSQEGPDGKLTYGAPHGELVVTNAAEAELLGRAKKKRKVLCGQASRSIRGEAQRHRLVRERPVQAE